MTPAYREYLAARRLIWKVNRQLYSEPHACPECLKPTKLNYTANTRTFFRCADHGLFELALEEVDASGFLQQVLKPCA